MQTSTDLNTIGSFGINFNFGRAVEEQQIVREISLCTKRGVNCADIDDDLVDGADCTFRGDHQNIGVRIDGKIENIRSLRGSL